MIQSPKIETITTKLIVMRPSQPIETVTLNLPADPGYHRLAAIIEPYLDGGDLEHVTVLADPSGGTDYRRCDMFVDENGMRKGLPRNEAATAIYRRNSMRRHPDTDPERLPCIVGTAILFDRIVWT